MTIGLALGSNHKFVTRVIRKGLGIRPTTSCGNGLDVEANLDKLSLKGPEADDAYQVLIAHANESTACRAEIIHATMQEMNTQEPGIVSNPPGYNLWVKGSALLTSLKAVEALDLMIKHLDLDDGHHSSFGSHEPIFLAVREFGDSAIPNLAFALRNNKNPYIRNAAVLSLADTCAPAAMDAMSQALATEPDPDIRKLIEYFHVGPDDEKSVNSDPNGPHIVSDRVKSFWCGE